MNIAFIGNLREEAVNGVINSANNLAKGLDAQGVKVFFYGVSEKDETHTVGNFVYRKFKKSKNPLTISKEFKKLLTENPDQIEVFHFHSVFVLFFIPVYKCLVAKGYPYVMTPNGGYDRNVLEKNKFQKKIYISLFERNFIKKSATVICVHRDEPKDILNISKGTKTIYIPNAVELKESDKETIVQQNGNSDSKILVYLGRFDIRHKGLDKLLYIFKKMEEKDPSIQLKLYGQGRDRSILENIIKEQGIIKAKIFEPVYGLEKGKALSEATAFIHLSNWEAFGLSIVEAMLKGKTVILSTGCTLSSLLLEYKAGLVVDNNIEKAAEQTLEYLNAPSKMANDGILLKEIAEREFSIKTISTKTIELYNAVKRAK
jgi:glycosyltransferase involved in cell wall biosynthesis